MIERIDAPGADVEAAILAPLMAYNREAGGQSGHRTVAFVVRDGGVIVGGLWAVCAYDWVFVKLLAVPEGRRRQGLGRALMAAAEELARAEGLAGLWLDTFSFQARGFYERVGFTCFGELPGHPAGGARYFMSKRVSRYDERGGVNPEPGGGVG